MKRLYLFALFCISGLVFMLSSCDETSEKKDAIPGQVIDLQAESSYGRVILSWTIPDDPHFYYVKITYTNPVTGAPMELFTTRYSADETGSCKFPIDGFIDYDEHEFHVTSYSFGRKPSEPVMIKGSALEPPVNIVQATVQAEPDFMGALISWQNETGIPVIIHTTYNNRNGATETAETTSDTAGKIRVGNVDAENPNLRITIYDNAKVTASETLTFNGFKPIPAVDLNQQKRSWSVVFQDPNLGGNGAEKLIDGNLYEIWHSAVYPTYPISAIFDMKQDIVITSLGFYKRTPSSPSNHEDWGPAKIGVALSADNKIWSETIVFKFNPKDDNRQTLYVNQMLYAARYIRIQMLESSGENFVYLAEMEVEGGIRAAENQ